MGYLLFMERLTRDEMRAKLEEALRALAPGKYEKPDHVEDEEFDAFLFLRGPKGHDIAYFCDEEVVSVEFDPAAKHFEYIRDDEGIADEDEDGETDADEDDGEDGEEGLSEEELKAVLKGVVQITLDITAERVFAAEYKKLFARVSGFHPPSEFASMKARKGFTSVSWNGTYDASASPG
jgi:hypothetical protein